MQSIRHSKFNSTDWAERIAKQKIEPRDYLDNGGHLLLKIARPQDESTLVLSSFFTTKSLNYFVSGQVYFEAVNWNNIFHFKHVESFYEISMAPFSMATVVNLCAEIDLFCFSLYNFFKIVKSEHFKRRKV